MKKVGVDIVIPSWNYAQYLSEAVDSALSQEGADIHVVVVDDGSDDATQEVLERYDQEAVTVARHATRRGLSAARNTGLSLLRHDWVAFLDADDVFPAERTAALWHAINGNPDMIALGLAEEFGEAGVVVANDRPTGLSLQTALISRRVMEQVGGFDESLTYGGNVDWMARAVRERVEMRATSAVTLRRRIHGHNMSRQISSHPQDYLTIVRRHGEALAKLRSMTQA